MTTSGTYSAFLSNADVVLSAYERVQVRAPELRQEHMLSAYKEFILLQAEWSNRQVNLWKVIRTQLTLTPGTATYTLPVQTVLVLDASVVLNFGTQNESRRYITPISRTEYLSYANQQTPGPPTQYWYDRLETPTITFYPVPDNTGPFTFDFFSVLQQQDATLPGGVTPDVPYRWLDALVAGLAYRFARLYNPQLEAARKADYQEAWQVAAAQDTENVGLMLAPNFSTYYNR